MVQYTTGKSKDHILTCLIIISGFIDFLINCLINFILNYLSVNFNLNYFNIYNPSILFILILFGSYFILFKLFDEYFWNNKYVLNYLNIHDLNGIWVGHTETLYHGKKDFKVIIKQTWTEIEMNLKTNQSSSELISFSFNKLKPIHDMYYIGCVRFVTDFLIFNV